MPKRSNDFQQLVYLIEHQLRDRPDTVVTQSKMLTDRISGEEAEVDVVIECAPNGFAFVIGIECRGRSRRPTVEWVREMVGKHKNLTHKLVLVANHPLTSKAAKLAALEGVDVIQLGDVATTDWPAAIDTHATNLLFASFDFSIKSYVVGYDVPIGGPQLDLGQSVTVTNGLGKSGTLGEVLGSLLHNRDMFAKPAMDNWFKLPLEKRKDEHLINVKFEPPPEQTWMVTQGPLQYRMRTILCDVATKVGEAPLNVARSQYRDLRVAHGAAVLTKGSMAGQTAQLVMTERQGQAPSAAITFTGALGGAVTRTLDLEQPVKPVGG